MKVVVAGSSGLIGTALTDRLRAAGHHVVRLVRRPPAGPDELGWNPADGRLGPAMLSGADAVVNLCGAGVGDRRWTGAYKQQLRDSRIVPTDVLAAAVAQAGVPTLINASGINYYGHTGDRIVDESAAPGSGVLAGLCVVWEAATAPAAAAGARVVLLRSGLVFAPSGGALGRLRLVYSLGLGGRLGTGRQYLPWISLTDELRAIGFALTSSALRGPANLVGPAPVTNAEFNRALARALGRPAPWRVPQFAVRAALGELADEALLTGPRAIPAALESAGFGFEHNTIGAALDAALHGSEERGSAAHGADGG